MRYLLLILEKYYNISLDEAKIKFQQTIVVSAERNASRRVTYRGNEKRYSQDNAETYKKVSIRPLNQQGSIYLNELL